MSTCINTHITAPVKRGTYNNAVFAYMNVRSDLCSIDYRVLLHQYMITNVEWEKSNSEKKKTHTVQSNTNVYMIDGPSS